MAHGGRGFAAQVSEVAARKKSLRPRKEPATDPGLAEILPSVEDALVVELGHEVLQGEVGVDQLVPVASESAKLGT